MSGPIPARVEAAAKGRLLELIDEAVGKGWSMGRVCGVLQLDRVCACRWQVRRAEGTLDDRAAPGGNPIHGLLGEEEQAIIDLFTSWGPVDLSQRKLAHRGSCIGRGGCLPRRWTGSWPATAFDSAA